jgi:hypothetical protein
MTLRATVLHMRVALRAMVLVLAAQGCATRTTDPGAVRPAAARPGAAKDTHLLKGGVGAAPYRNTVVGPQHDTAAPPSGDEWRRSLARSIPTTPDPPGPTGAPAGPPRNR